MPFDDEAALIFGELRAELAKKGTPVGAYNLQIAAIAPANDLILITRNTKEPGRIKNLYQHSDSLSDVCRRILNNSIRRYPTRIERKRREKNVGKSEPIESDLQCLRKSYYIRRSQNRNAAEKF